MWWVSDRVGVLPTFYQYFTVQVHCGEQALMLRPRQVSLDAHFLNVSETVVRSGYRFVRALLSISQSPRCLWKTSPRRPPKFKIPRLFTRNPRPIVSGPEKYSEAPSVASFLTNTHCSFILLSEFCCSSSTWATVLQISRNPGPNRPCHNHNIIRCLSKYVAMPASG